MRSDAELVTYYRARAAEYEKVYAKPERQGDLRALHEIVPAFFTGRRVLEVACGTGYWTRLLSERAASVLAIDLAFETLQIARGRQHADSIVEYREGDAFDLAAVPGAVDAAFAGFWWSHVRREDLQRFLRGLHERLSVGDPVFVLDNRYVAGSNWPISRTDSAGNTYQRRRLESGPEHEVLKNFPMRSEVHSAVVAAGGTAPIIVEMTYYWYATYSVAGTC